MNHPNSRFPARAAALFVAGLAPFAGAQDLSDGHLDAGNEAQRDKILALLGSHNASWGAAWSPDPIFGNIAGASAWQLNLGLKTVRPVLQAPPDRAVLPNSGDGCSFDFTYTHNVNEVYTDYLGLGPAFDPGAPRLAASWGVFGQPTVFHGNSDVRIETTLDSKPFGLPGNQSGQASMSLPIGRHSVGYRATTQISDLLDVPPWFALEMLGPVDLARKSLGRELLEAAITGAMTNYGPAAINRLAAAGGIGSIEPRDTFATSERQQRFYVLDVDYPLLTVRKPVVELEAINVGGRVLTRALEAEVRESTLDWSDRCRERKELDIRLLAPAFLPVGQDIEVTWRLRDPGPSSLDPVGDDPDYPDGRIDDRRNEVRATQTWQIRDTLPPIIEPPRGRVLETDAASASVTLGTPAVFDLADPEARVLPLIDGAPVVTPAVELASPSRTEVVWRATDASGNSSGKSQWITLKPAGTNTAPQAVDGSVSAISHEEIDIELLGRDDDLIDGRYDQLAFAIAEPPENGEFVAPLFPFFIEDYRIEANLPEDIQAEGDTDGDGLINPLELQQLFSDWCEDPVQRQVPLPRDLVRNPAYVAVTDDGTTFVLDQVTRCNQSDPDLDPRIAQFDAAGGLVAEIEFPDDFVAVRSFSVGHDGFLYLKVPSEPDVIRIDPTPVPSGSGPARMLSERFQLRPPNTDEGSARNTDRLRSAAIDANDLLYVTDGNAVYVFDTTRPQTAGSLDTVLFVGDLVPQGGFTSAARDDLHMDTAIDSAGNLYFSDEALHRIYKYSPSTLDRTTDEFTPGEQVGWMGRCSGNLTAVPACDTANQKSFGFSCTDELCAVDDGVRDVDAERAACGLLPSGHASNRRAGCRAGQFDAPLGIAIDPNDILYVADYNNFRIQRFDADGLFGGEARSECDGRCFVLGDFGKPVDVSVNSTNFYVLDTEFDLLHVFETTPITNVDDANLEPLQNAFVTYRSANNFRGVDSFAFTVADGLATSMPATVTIDVARNFRPPEAVGPLRVTTNEDESVDLELVAADPDGDALRYTITEPPANGRLEGDAPDLVYVPNPDFEGTDTFTFVVDDSLSSVPALTSAPAVVTIEVLPSPDDPTLEIELPERTGVAYETQFSAYSYDPDVGDVFSVTVDWGDGSIPQAATTDMQALGIWPVLFTDTPFEARVEGTHAWASPGTYTVTVCVADHVNGASLAGCGTPEAKTVLTREIVVEELIELVVHTTDDLDKVVETQCPPEAVADGTCPLRALPLVDGDTVTYTAVIDHVQLGDATAPATGVTAVFELPPELTPTAVTVDAPGAVTQGEIDGARVTATISALGAGEQARVSVTAASPGDILAERPVDITGFVTSDVPDPGGRNPIAARTVLAMNPAGDADGDGVANGSDAFPGDPLEWADNDGDGIGDNSDRDDDNDGLPDRWERRYGFDDQTPGEQSADGDGDGLLNIDEFAAGTRPDVADSDRDGHGDASDNCPAAWNRQQFDLDGDGAGDACDADQFARAIPLGNLGDSAAADWLLVRGDAGRIDAFLKDGTSNVSVGAGTIALVQGGTGRLYDLAALPGADTFAVVAVNSAGEPELDILDARNGTALGTALLAGGEGTPAGIAALARPGDAGYVVVINRADERIVVERRHADDGALAGSADMLEGYSALAAAAVADGSVYALLAVELDTGALELLSFSAMDDSPLRRWTIEVNDWLHGYVAGTAEGFSVLHQALGGTSGVTVIDAGDDAPVADFEPMDGAWTALGIGKIDGSVAVLAADDMGEIRIVVADPANGSITADESYHTASDAPRGLAAGNGSVGALASNAAGEVGLELRDAAGGGSRLLTAEATSPPPPPPPPPPTGNDGGGGGGGGATGWFLLLLAAAATLPAARRDPPQRGRVGRVRNLLYG